jgi:hypothetical protein
MALYYRLAEFSKGSKGSSRATNLAKAKAAVSRELKIRPLYFSVDAEGEYLRVDFIRPRRTRSGRSSRGPRTKAKANNLKIFGIEFTPR